MIPMVRLHAFVAAAFSFAMLGCGGVKIGPHAVVHGSATLDGAALADAEIRFIPKASPDLGTAQSKTDAKGAFIIQPDANKNNLLKPGQFIVVITKVVATKADGAMGTPTLNLVPEDYGQQAKTPLVADLKDGDNKLSPFELSTPKAKPKTIK